MLEEINFLSHEDFYYFIRVENPTNAEQMVTARIFMAPEVSINNRSSWIEMDKFSYKLEPFEYAVIFRPADQSSVIRKPALRASDLNNWDEPSQITDQQEWCDCGWPYTLLLPRGTDSGMPFRLFVMFSNGNDLVQYQNKSKCTSVSYCGLKDRDYPDLREMGYPFNRPFNEHNNFSQVIQNQNNMTVRTISIRCRNI